MKNYGQLFSKMLQEGNQREIHLDPKKKYFYLQHEDEDFQFQIRMKDFGKFGVVLDYISISKTDPIRDVALINKRLDEQSEAIQKKITFLLEEFKLIEMDNQSKRAQLRSYPPHTAENSKHFYEIVLDEGSKVHFQRYQYSITEKRYEKITSQLTLETFERLINELTDLLR